MGMALVTPFRLTPGKEDEVDATLTIESGMLTTKQLQQDGALIKVSGGICSDTFKEG